MNPRLFEHLNTLREIKDKLASIPESDKSADEKRAARLFEQNRNMFNPMNAVLFKQINDLYVEVKKLLPPVYFEPPVDPNKVFANNIFENRDKLWASAKEAAIAHKEDDKQALYFARLVKYEFDRKGIKISDMENLDEFKSGRLLQAITTLKQHDEIVKTLFDNRDDLWEKAKDAAIGHGEEEKQAMYFALLVKMELDRKGIKMSDIAEDPVFQRGRLEFAKRVILKIEETEKRSSRQTPQEATPESEEAEQMQAVRDLAMKLAKEGKGLVTKAGVKGAENIGKAAKLAALANHPDKGAGGDKEVLLAANEIIDLVKRGQFDEYKKVLEQERNRLRK